MSENTNTNCIVDNNRLITEFENLEFIQVMPARRNVKKYDEFNKTIASDPSSVLLMKQQSILNKKDTTDAKKLEATAKVVELEEKLSKKFSADEGNNTLILSTLEGTKFKKGGFYVDSKEESFEFEDFDDIPPLVYSELLKNAFKLITIQKDEEKN
jgi:hypothetical protein